MLDEQIKQVIINVPDFPKPGIDFKDITPLFLYPRLVNKIIKLMAKSAKQFNYDVIVAPELRGYLFGIPLSLKTKKPFVFVRKKGKLPRETISTKYDLEYSTTELELHKDSIKPGQKILIVDDLLATGGTTNAIIDLVTRCGGQVVGKIVLIQLKELNNKSKIPICSIINY